MEQQFRVLAAVAFIALMSWLGAQAVVELIRESGNQPPNWLDTSIALGAASLASWELGGRAEQSRINAEKDRLD
jgi:hypothetical protein